MRWRRTLQWNEFLGRRFERRNKRDFLHLAGTPFDSEAQCLSHRLLHCGFERVSLRASHGDALNLNHEVTRSQTRSGSRRRRKYLLDFDSTQRWIERKPLCID